MIKAAALFPISLALAAVVLAPRAWAQSPDGQQEGPREIEKCQTIDKSGSYKLVNNLTFTGNGVCLQISANAVTVDLAGFRISGPGVPGGGATAAGTGIAAANDTTGVTVRNGSISGFFEGVVLDGNGSIVAGLRVIGSGCPCLTGISATGIVRGNTSIGIAGLPGEGTGISATGTVTGNYATGSRIAGIQAGQGSTVIGNTSVHNPGGPGIGIFADCPSNVTDNTAVNNTTNLVLNGNGCNNTNNVAP